MIFMGGSAEARRERHSPTPETTISRARAQAATTGLQNLVPEVRGRGWTSAIVLVSTAGVSNAAASTADVGISSASAPDVSVTGTEPVALTLDVADVAPI